MTISAPLRSRRLEARLDPDTDDLIAQAARIVGQSRSSFVVDSARDAAALIVARSDVTLMPTKQFDALISSLDQPDPAPRLAAAFAEPRVFVRS
ncbi:MAG: DUF1778 domain-containing protein [Propionibacteriaceae bacterium]|jgi:uncharacterized protein (DUF1778 family)|nr:DUF1778 domain-containing protein [Propionibacteriaceae bacterium]